MGSNFKQIYILILLFFPVFITEAEAQFDREWKVYLVPFSHTDVGYTDPVQTVIENHAKYLDTVIDYIYRTEGNNTGERFKWTIEIPWILEYYIENRSQSRVDTLFNLIREGSIEVGGMHFGMQTDICGPEELVRSLYYSNKLAEENNFDIKTVLINDTPGFTWSLAQILSKSKIPYLSAAMNSVFSDFFKTTTVPYLFNWESQEGRRTLVWRNIDKEWAYLEGAFTQQIYATYNNMQSRVEQLLIKLQNEGYPYDAVYINCGTGDNGAPNMQIVNNSKQWNSSRTGAKMIIATASEFFDYVSSKYAAEIPVYKGDAPNWWTWIFGPSAPKGYSVSREAQLLLPESEKYSSIAEHLTGDGYSAESYEEAYVNNMLFEDHNLGSNSDTGNEEFWELKMGWVNSAKQTGITETDRALELIKNNIESEGRSIAVFNSMSWVRSEAVFIEEEDMPAGSFNLTDAEGNTYEMQRLSDGRGVFYAEGVPALGYKVFRIKDGGTDGPKQINGYTLENSFYSITIDNKTGAVLNIFDKEQNIELTRGDGVFNQFLFNSTWPPSGIEVIESDSGAAIQRIKIKANAQGTNGYISEIVLHNNSKRIDFYNSYDRKAAVSSESIDYKFSFSNAAPILFYEIPFGYVELFEDELSGFRTKHYAAQRWAAVTGEGRSSVLALSNASTIAQPGGFSGVLRFLVSFYGPSTQYRAGTGEMNMNFSFTSNGDKLNPGANLVFSQNFNNPLRSIVIEGEQSGSLTGEELSFIQISGDPLFVSTIKKAASGDGYVIRIYNPADSISEGRLEFNSNINAAYEVTMLEEELSTIESSGSYIDLVLNRHEIKTIKVKLQSISTAAEEIIPGSYNLDQNYPNPFNPETVIRYGVGEDGSKVVLKVYDILGREAAVIVNSVKDRGSYDAVFNGRGLPSGVYFYRMEGSYMSDVKKMLLIK